MTVPEKRTGATSASAKWLTINWSTMQRQVLRLQMRIAKAMREGRQSKVKSLQWILTHSYAAKLLAVKQVSQNKGSRTAGSDGIKWTTASQKLVAVNQLKRALLQTGFEFWVFLLGWSIDLLKTKGPIHQAHLS